MSKKSNNWINLSIVSVIFLMFTSSCGMEGKNNPVLLSTTDKVPTLTTIDMSNISQSLAISGGNITSDGGASVTSRGVCWNTTTNPTTALSTKTSDGSGSGTFSSNITGLTTATIYFVRAYAVNSAGTAYGNEISFKTLADGQIGSITDIDGNIYKTVVVGAQVWMSENLKTTKFRDGSAIPNVTDNTQWSKLTTSAYCNYNNDNSKTDTYGRLYNWFAVTDSRKIAPTGWHVASDSDWSILINYMIDKGSGYQGSGNDIAKSLASKTGWNSDGIAGTAGNDPANNNSSGFNAVPGGLRSDGVSVNLGGDGFWWSSTEYSTSQSWFYFMQSNSAIVVRTWRLKDVGMSVRCIKD